MNIFSNNIWQGFQSLKITFEFDDGREQDFDIEEIRQVLDG